ncbi:molybdenum cofactor guanylyltransferase [Allorhizobium sp. BGMRC 0089]|uniref:molybdenum cofactor guanylyltransferase MobA n=1 Tax=Allorhizobium sonneratiae TaxID=2934936 RepID=UPI0020340EC2|nr:molybdenum cofactor guanylyltransferase MobA [Allorhizobium sonneratiae]MCM2292923.1 molybdenum cofactor guanylyltransferase [Allorhizobium sonneratiae]
MKSPGVILAGGLSRRMGQSKAMTLLCGRSLLQHVADILLPQVALLGVNSNDPQLVTTLPVIADQIPGFVGPLAGIAAAMGFARQMKPGASHVLIAPVDTPFLPANLAERLKRGVDSVDSVVLAASGGRVHPVIGLWPLSLQAEIENWLDKPENRKLMVFLERCSVQNVIFPDVETKNGPRDPFFNINTPEDRQKAEDAMKALYP